MQRPSRYRRARLIYRVLVTVAAFLLLCWTAAVTVSVSFQEMLPSLSAKVGVADGRALGNLAEQTAAAGSVSDAARMARAAVQRDPTVVDAFRVLGFAAIEAGEVNTATELFSHADRLSRRDVGSQLWLFQHYGKGRDGQAALRHLDAAMGSDIELRNRLLPLLVAGLTDPQIIEPLANTLARRPDWGPALVRAAGMTGAPLENVDRLFRLADARGAEIEPADWGSLMNRLVDAGHYAEASDLYPRLSGRRLEGGINDGEFEHSVSGTPFDWSYSSGDDHEAAPVAAPAGRTGSVLAFRHGDAPPQVLLRQLLVLRPGKYLLTGVSLMERLDRAEPPTLSLVCAEGQAAIGRLAPLASTGGWTTFAFSFEVPTKRSCWAQWLELRAGTTKTDGRVLGYVDGLHVRTDENGRGSEWADAEK